MFFFCILSHNIAPQIKCYPCPAMWVVLQTSSETKRNKVKFNFHKSSDFLPNIFRVFFFNFIQALPSLHLQCPSALAIDCKGVFSYIRGSIRYLLLFFLRTILYKFFYLALIHNINMYVCVFSPAYC